MSSTPDSIVREQLLYLINGGGAHLDFEDAFADFPPEDRGRTIPGVPHSAWQQLEHLRICQWDILEFSRDPEHVSPSFPDGLWPVDPEPPREESWAMSLEAFRSDRKQMCELVSNPETDLYAPIPHGDGQTILREAMLVADHNSYHIGQVIVLRRALGIWNTE